MSNIRISTTLSTSSAADALSKITNGEGNTCGGKNSGYNITEGNRNVSLGLNSLYDNIEGDENIAIGVDAGRHITQNRNIAIGKLSGPKEDDSYSDTISIGTNAYPNGSNVIQLGDNEKSMVLMVGDSEYKKGLDIASNGEASTGTDTTKALCPGNLTSVTKLGVIGNGTWQGDSISNGYIDNDLTIDGGIVDNTKIGSQMPNEGTFTKLTTHDLLTSKRIITDISPQNYSMSAQELAGGLFSMNNNTASNKNITLPNGNDIINKINKVTVGSSFLFFLKNGNPNLASSGTDIILKEPSDGSVSIEGGASVKSSHVRSYLVIVDDVSSKLVTLHCVGNYQWI